MKELNKQISCAISFGFQNIYKKCINKTPTKKRNILINVCLKQEGSTILKNLTVHGFKQISACFLGQIYNLPNRSVATYRWHWKMKKQVL